MEVVNMSDKRKRPSKVKEFLKQDPSKLDVGGALIMTAASVFVTGVVTVSINTSIDVAHGIMNKRRK